MKEMRQDIDNYIQAVPGENLHTKPLEKISNKKREDQNAILKKIKEDKSKTKNKTRAVVVLTKREPSWCL